MSWHHGMEIFLGGSNKLFRLGRKDLKDLAKIIFFAYLIMTKTQTQNISKFKATFTFALLADLSSARNTHDSDIDIHELFLPLCAAMMG
jgi:hypothetical protein